MGSKILDGIEALLKAGAKRAPKAAPDDAAEAARVARGKENYPVEAYRGEGVPIEGEGFIVGHPDRKDTGWLGTGIYSTNAPSLANFYASAKQKPSGEGMNVMPLRLDLRNPKVIDLFQKERMRFKPQEERDAWLKQQLDAGHDGVTVRYAHKIDDSPDAAFVEEYMVPNANQIRSRFAQFDPAKRDSSDLLAGIGAGALALPALNEVVDESKFADGGVPHFGDGGILKRGMKAIARATPKPAVKATELPMADEALVKSAIEKFGLTRNPAEAGYIMPKGQMLDLSGKVDTGDYQRIGDFHVPNRGMRDYMGGKRYTDHREIQDIPGIDAGGTDAMYDFMTRARSARFMPMDTGVGFEMTVMPDEQQLLRALEGHRRLTARTPDRDLPRFEITDPKKQATVDSLSYEGSEIEPLMKWFRERVGGMASGGLAGYDDGGSVDYEMEAERQRRRALAGRQAMPDLVEQTRIRDMNRSMPSYSMGDAARTVGEIARDLPGMAARGIGQHYRDQAVGLMTDPLATAGRNVRDVSEMALPVSSLYKMADVATGAEGAEAPDYMDVGMDVANVLSFKGGRDLARRAARPALGLAAAGIAMQPDEAEAGPKSDLLKSFTKRYSFEDIVDPLKRKLAPNEYGLSDRFHGTTLDRAASIADEGLLRTHRPNYGTDQDAWPDGMITPRSYWTQNPDAVSSFIPGNVGAYLRADPDKAMLKFLNEKYTGDQYLTDPVDARLLDILTKEGWRPLRGKYANGGVAKDDTDTLARIEAMLA
jgi:hypothetical protein